MYAEYDHDKKRYENFFYSVKDGELKIQCGCLSLKGKTKLTEEQIPMYLERIQPDSNIGKLNNNYYNVKDRVNLLCDEAKERETWREKNSFHNLFSTEIKIVEGKINELGREYDIFGKQFSKVFGDSFNGVVEWDKFIGFEPHKMKGVIELGQLYQESEMIHDAVNKIKDENLDTDAITDLKVKNGMNGKLIGFIYNNVEAYLEVHPKENEQLFVVDPLGKGSLKGFNLTRSLENVWRTRKNVIFKDKEGIFATIEGQYEEIMEKTTLKVYAKPERNASRIYNGKNWIEVTQEGQFPKDIGDKFLKLESRCVAFNMGYKDMKRMLGDVSQRDMLPKNVRLSTIGVEETRNKMEEQEINIIDMSPELKKAVANAQLLSEIFEDERIYTFKSAVTERYGVIMTQGTEIETGDLTYKLYNGFSMKYGDFEIKGRTPHGVKLSEDLITKDFANQMKVAVRADWKAENEIRNKLNAVLKSECPGVIIKNEVKNYLERGR